MQKWWLPLLAVTMAGGCVISVNDNGGGPTFRNTHGGAGGKPYSDAVYADDFVFLSGTLGTMPGSGELAEGGIRAETLQAMQNISRTLSDFDLTTEDLVKCTVFLADIEEWSAMNEVYVTFFREPPARTAVEVSRLPRDARIEIECIAYDN